MKKIGHHSLKNCISFTRYLSSPSTNLYWNDRKIPNEPKFEKVLIANRGEIACRVIQTLRRQGIKSVAVYSAADSAAKHVQMADEAIFIGPSPVNQSYLVFDKIISACKTTGADGVHPGYGLLSENMEFCKALVEAGITFIGPNTNAIKAMGDKIESKRVAAEAKVNCIPGYMGPVSSEEHAVEISRQIGYPVMIKASAGGGGKGMRVAWNDEEARENYKLCKQEAGSIFLDDRLLIEKYITSQRHIEVQIIGDNYGNIVHLNERECSIQRRNQKVIEEAPSPFLDPKTRQKMGEQAIALAKAVGYTNAGTCEFLVDKDRNFYFLEMNTRLQVEHPITECITGIDIVHQMLRVAKGNKLLHKQQDIPIKGWAIESRVYAEDPYKSFGTPSVGRLHKYREPDIQNIRCDSGIREGSEISVFYDAMISKLISYGDTREEAIETMTKALDRYVICGVTHNLSLLSDIMGERRFIERDISTGYLDEVYPEGFKGRDITENEFLSIMAVASTLKFQSLLELYTGPDRPACLRFSLNTNGSISHEISVNMNGGSYLVTIDGRTFTVDCKMSRGDVLMKAVVDGKSEFYQLLALEAGGDIEIQYKGTKIKMEIVEDRFKEYSKYMKERPMEAVSKSVACPMPGLLKSVSVNIGQLVNQGMEVCVVESMKMQNSLKASCEGKVKKIFFKSGDTLSEDDVIVEIE